MAFGKKPEVPEDQKGSAQAESGTAMDIIQAEEQAKAPENDEQLINQGNVTTESTQVELNEEAANEDAPYKGLHRPIQAEPATVVFVPQEDFEGTINKDTWQFTKGVPVKVTRDQANVWVDAEKGYVR